MFRKLKHVFHHNPPYFTYPTLPQEPYTTRMIRLLPHEDKSAPIQCELFNYDLSETGLGMHLYQALSYVWGSEMKPESIILNGCIFHVTANLYTALLYLRNRQLERILWVDAICINQDEEYQGYEKSKQIPLMRTIYAQAERVIIWLGDATEDGDKALEKIRCLGENGYEATKDIWYNGERRRYTNSIVDSIESSDEEIHSPGEAAAIWYNDDPDPIENYDACLRLLQRDWFSRIWVLQEVGVARCVYVMCGSVYINGHIFCEGLTRLRLSSDLWSRVGPVTYLIHGALYRPKYQLDSRGSISIGELLGMYQYHNATKQHDKVYALLGLSADPITDALWPNYNLPWKDVFKEVTSYLFPECSVETGNETETVVIKGKGWILGHVHFVEETFSEIGKQKIEVLFNDTAKSFGCKDHWETDWKLQASAVLIQHGDIICLLKEASKPSIIRLFKDHFILITPAVTPQRRHQKESTLAAIPQERCSTNGLCDILLTWKIPLAQRGNNHKSEIMFTLMNEPPKFREEPYEAEKRLKHIMLVVIDIAMRTLEQKIFRTEAIERLLRQSGTKDPIIEELVEGTVYGYNNPTEIVLQDLLQYQEHDRPISEETLIVATTNCGTHGCIIMELFLQYQGANLPVSEEVVKAVGGNEYGGYKTMETLFRYRGENLPVSEKVVKAAAGNRGSCGPKILAVLFQQRGENLPISEEVVKAAAENDGEYGSNILEILFQQRGENLPISEKVVKAAAGNRGSCGPNILAALFQQRGENLPIPEEVVKAAAENNGWYGPIILEILFQQRGENLPISKEVVRAAAGNNGNYGPTILQMLFQQREDLPLSEEVVRAAAGNTGDYGYRILEILFRHRGEDLPISEEVAKAAAENDGEYGHIILQMLFQHRGENLPVSEEVVRAAAGNNGRYGYRIIEILFQYRGENLPVSEEVVRAAAGNDGGYRYRILQMLFQQREDLPLSEEVVRAAAGNDRGYGP